MLKKTVIVSSLLLVGVALPALAARERLLGSARLAYQEEDKAVLNIATCPNPAYTHVQLRVKKGDADITALLSL
ncbi:hypothetical protein V0288_07675 [Pannus brasiliensis CCIBt3594]|uniref:Uncharacterized protein n=1 Tax=Pannus brasiliensis CCIBt3594 TaxID=1427578 RepID=A0AAW9QTD3_9CHRO